MLLTLLACAGPESSGPPARQPIDDTAADTAADTAEVVPADTSDLPPCEGAPPLHLNELVAANLHGLTDADGETSDWLEIALSADASQAVSLAGWTLSDDPAADPAAAWPLPDVSLVPGATLLVWASGKDRREGELHADFSLDDGGDTVLLRMADGCVADRVDTPRLYGDVAYGRAPDDAWAYFLEPTPGAANTTESRPGFADPPVLSPAPGFHAGKVTVSAVGDHVRYTLTGAPPESDDASLASPITVDPAAGPVVVRARAFKDGLWPSRVTTATYADPAELGGVRVISLVMNPPDLWDDKTGIYVYGTDYEHNYPYFGANFWELWERDVHVEIFAADGTLEVAQDAGIQIAGGYSRAFDQRNFELIARTGYGPETFDDRVFPNEDIDAFHRLYLRNGGDWCGTQIVDASVQALFRDADGRRVASVDAQAYTPTLVYLNGAFWGVYELKERLDEWWIADHRGEGPDDLDRVKLGWTHQANWELEQGTWDAFDALNTLAATADLSDPKSWAAFEGMVDLDNLASAVVAQGWIGNTDWWGNNLRLWRPRRADGRWRWMVYDFGHGWPDWHYDHLATSVNGTWTGLPLGAALRNQAFRDRFTNVHADFLNTTLVGEDAADVVRGLAAEVRPVMQRQRDRWCGGASMAAWEQSVDYAVTFAENRAGEVDTDLVRALGLSGHAALALDADPPEAASFHLTVADVPSGFRGAYYQGVPVPVTITPAAGWVFDGWSDGETAASRTLPMAGDTTLTARFHAD